MDYSTLFITIKGYLENDFPDSVFTDSAGTGTATITSTEQINTFITQAETRIFNSVQFPSLRQNVTGTITANNKYLSCPDDFLAPYSLAVIENFGDADETYSFLLNKDVNFIRESYPTPNDKGLPAYYALFGPTSASPNELSFILGPTPDAQYTAELHYFFYPESITTTSTGTTWLGDNFDPVLLYGSLVEAYTFLKGKADLIQLYNGKFNEALALAKRLGDVMEKSDQYRSSNYRGALK